MREFNGIDALIDFGTHLGEIAIAQGEILHKGLDHAAELIEKEAKAEFGVYQEATGPFQEWPELAESTKAQRIAQGFTENEPLLRTGELRDSISREVHGLEAVIGSTSDLMIYHEFGTSRMPARPVFGPALFRNKDAIESMVAEAAVLGMMGAKTWAEARMPSGDLGRLPASGYDYDVKA